MCRVGRVEYLPCKQIELEREYCDRAVRGPGGTTKFCGTVDRVPCRSRYSLCSIKTCTSCTLRPVMEPCEPLRLSRLHKLPVPFGTPEPGGQSMALPENKPGSILPVPATSSTGFYDTAPQAGSLEETIPPLLPLSPETWSRYSEREYAPIPQGQRVPVPGGANSSHQHLHEPAKAVDITRLQERCVLVEHVRVAGLWKSYRDFLQTKE